MSLKRLRVVPDEESRELIREKQHEGTRPPPTSQSEGRSRGNEERRGRRQRLRGRGKRNQKQTARERKKIRPGNETRGRESLLETWREDKTTRTEFE